MQGWILGNAQEALSEYEKSEDEPVQWDEATPQKYRKSTFERVITAAVEQSSAGIEYVDVRCEEEPCVALLRVPDDDTAKNPWLRKLQGTPAWSETYDKLISLWATTVECGDGSTESVALIGKAWKDMPDAQWLHVNKRHKNRLGALIKSWKCRGER